MSKGIRKEAPQYLALWIVLGCLMLIAQVNTYAEGTPASTMPLYLSGFSYTLPATDGDSQPVHFIMGIEPFSFLFSSDIDGISFTNGSRTEFIDGYGSWTPTLKLGINWEMGDKLDADITGGVGYLWNEAFSAPFYAIDAGLNWKLASKFKIGPHAGILFMDAPEWSEQAQVTFSDSTGYFIGIRSTFQLFKSMDMYVSADYIGMDDMDITTSGGWTASQSKMDLSGFGITLGMMLKF